MKQYPITNQMAARSDEGFFTPVSNNSTSPHLSYSNLKRSDSLSQAELYNLYRTNQKDIAIFNVRLDSCEKRLSVLEKNMVVKLEINTLKSYELKRPLEAILESDDGGFIARMVDLPLFGYGDDTIEAMDNLKYEVESLYSELMEDDNFSEEWLKAKKFLRTIFRKK